MNTLDQIPAAPLSQAIRTSTPLRLLAAAGLRLVLAALFSCAVVLLGIAGVNVTTAPRWLSLLVEPLSFLLTPGGIYAWVKAMHTKVDFSAATVVRMSLVFYFIVFAVFLLARLIPAVQALLPPRTRPRRSR